MALGFGAGGDEDEARARHARRAHRQSPDRAVPRIMAAPLPESAEKLRRMLERLDQDGFTDFYG